MWSCWDDNSWRSTRRWTTDNERGKESGRDKTHRSCENDAAVGVKTASGIHESGSQTRTFLAKTSMTGAVLSTRIRWYTWSWQSKLAESSETENDSGYSDSTTRTTVCGASVASCERWDGVTRVQAELRGKQESRLSIPPGTRKSRGLTGIVWVSRAARCLGIVKFLLLILSIHLVLLFLNLRHEMIHRRKFFFLLSIKVICPQLSNSFRLFKANSP